MGTFRFGVGTGPVASRIATGHRRVPAHAGRCQTPAAKKAAPAAPSSAASPKFFSAARKRAEKLAKDPEKLQTIAEESYKSGAARSGPFFCSIKRFPHAGPPGRGLRAMELPRDPA